MKEIFKIIYITAIFTVVIFFINYNFFGSLRNDIENSIIEEKYIENEIDNNKEENDIENSIIEEEHKKNNIGGNKKENEIINKELINYYKEKINIKYNFYYYPKSFEKEINKLKVNLENIILENMFSNKISNIDIALLKDKIDRRGKMKNKEIKLFGAQNNNISEYISVFIHEFGHYIDLYFLEKKVFLDVSSKFYEISWIETEIKKPNVNIKDFVSGYAITNKYEDFAESFTYYVLHNKDFLEKAKLNPIIKQKYDFFGTYIFKNKEFFNTKFNEEEIKDYYRDITKIKFNENKLFNYLEKIKEPLY